MTKSALPELPGNASIWSAIHEFHRLCAKQAGGEPLSAEEEARVAALVDAFEPPHASSREPQRAHVGFPVNGRGVLGHRGGVDSARVIHAGLRKVWVETGAALSRGDPVALEVSGDGDERPFEFRGQVIRTYPATRRATVELSCPRE